MSTSIGPTVPGTSGPTPSALNQTLHQLGQEMQTACQQRDQLWIEQFKAQVERAPGPRQHPLRDKLKAAWRWVTRQPAPPTPPATPAPPTFEQRHAAFVDAARRADAAATVQLTAAGVTGSATAGAPVVLLDEDATSQLALLGNSLGNLLPDPENAAVSQRYLSYLAQAAANDGSRQLSAAVLKNLNGLSTEVQTGVTRSALLAAAKVINGPLGPALAGLFYETCKDISDGAEQNALAERVLGQATSASPTPAEHALIETAPVLAKAVNQSDEQTPATIALDMMRQGVHGDIESTLITLGRRSMEQTSDTDNAALLGKAAFEALQARSADPSVQQRCALALAAWESVSNSSSQESVCKAAFDSLSECSSDTLSAAASLGNSFIDKCDSDDEPAIGRAIIEQLKQQHGDEPRLQALLDGAMAAADAADSDDSKVAVYRAALEQVPHASADPVISLAALGAKSLADCDSDDEESIGSAILEAIGRHATNASTKVWADALGAATSDASNTDVSDVQAEAFKSLQSSTQTGSPEHLLSDLGLRLIEVADDYDDASAMGQTVLGKLDNHTQQAAIKTVIKNARDSVREADDTEGETNVLRMAFKTTRDLSATQSD